jgi:hypothetical protein
MMKSCMKMEEILSKGFCRTLNPPDYVPAVLIVLLNSYLQPCNVRNSNTMFCLTPDVTVCTTSRTKRSTSRDIQLPLVVLGFILDGYYNYDDLQKHPDLPSQVRTYGPPLIPMVEDAIQYRKGMLLDIKVLDT